MRIHCRVLGIAGTSIIARIWALTLRMIGWIDIISEHWLGVVVVRFDEVFTGVKGDKGKGVLLAGDVICRWSLYV